jgi:hypothetical protein
MTLHPCLLSLVTERAMESGAIEVPRDIVEKLARHLLRFRFECGDHIPPITDADLQAIYLAAAKREAAASTKH